MANEVSDQLEPWRDLKGKVVLVTGASSGLGREFCLDLAKAGCRIVAAARRVERLKSLCDEINNLTSAEAEPTSVRAVAVELDVCADGATIQRSVQLAWESFGTIDALVNNAGVRGTVKNPLDLSEEEWDHVIKTNLTGSWLVSKYVCMRMRDANQGGSVINVSSTSGINRGKLPGAVAYASSKAGLNTMTKIDCISKLVDTTPSIISTNCLGLLTRLCFQVMAVELGVHKIRVNSISPGLFRSEITEVLMQKEWLNKVALKINPLRTHGTSDPALTSLIRYLVHDSSQYVSGNIFIVDAGATLPGLPIFSSL